MRLKRSLAFGIGLVALAIASGMVPPALAAAATLRGEAMPQGYGRLSLSFDEPTTTRVRVANGVLIVGFGTSVKVDVAKLAAQLPDYVSIARIDPDGRGIRLALARPYRANLIEAGDKAFIDLLPENWRGMLPGPPPEVIAEMTERLRLAEAKAKEMAGKPPEPPPPLRISHVSLPTLERLIFAGPRQTQMNVTRSEDGLALAFDRPVTLDARAIRSALPDKVKLAGDEATAQGLTLKLALPADWQHRAFSDEDGMVLDLLPPERPQPKATPAVPVPAQASKPEPATATAPPPAVQKAIDTTAGRDPATVEPAPDPSPQKVQIVAGQNRIDVRFPRPTGAAAFSDGGVLTLVFDTRDEIAPDALKGALPGLISSASVAREGRTTLIRMRPAGERWARLFDEGNAWVLSFEDSGGKPAEVTAPKRDIDESGQTVMAVPLPGLTGVHWLPAGSTGLPMAIATAIGPARAVGKPFQFVEFGLPQTSHGIAILPRSDDIVARAGTGRVIIGRSGGLTVSSDGAAGPETAEATTEKLPPLIDPALWAKLADEPARDGARALMQDVIDASRGRKSQARLALARFYAAQNLMAEAKGPLGAMMADDTAMRENREALFLKGLVAAGMHRDKEALAAFNAPQIREDAEAGLWRALVQQRLGQNTQALASFRRGEQLLDGYPPALQTDLRVAMARAALVGGEVGVAERQIDSLDNLLRHVTDPEQLALLRAMLDEASGRPEAALSGYESLFDAKSRPVAAEAQLRAVKLFQNEKTGDLSLEEQIARLETVSVIWRGGELEIEALAELGRLYAEQKRWRDAFLVARRANETFPDHALTRRIHDETAQRFAEIFGGEKAESLPRIDALALFYDFKEFLPIGRRGDEITRLLADRLVEVDLLDQAAEILRYQMERRLTGAARTTVAARLAMVELMNRKPAAALRAIHQTRLVELPADIQRARLLLEAKALSDLSRTDQSLELLDGESGPEIDRLRADIQWTGRRWREAGEAHERLLGDAWRGDAPLSDGARADVMRAAVSYVMAGEGLALDRLRGKFAAKMAQSADARTFAFVTGADRSRPADIREMARAASAAESISEFMKAYRERYPGFASPVREGAPERPPAAPADAAEAQGGQKNG